MINLQLYDHLLQFPLFQGLSRTELQQMAGNTKFGFMKAEAGKTVVRDGEVCTALFFLINGRLTLTTRSDDGGYAVTEQLSAPWLLQPEALFGLTPRYTCTATVSATVSATVPDAVPAGFPSVPGLTAHFITLSKDEVLRLTDDFLIIRLNLLNMLSTLSQRRNRQTWHRTPQPLRDRIARFITDHCVYPAGPKDISILMERLAHELNDSRLDVSRALNAMQAEGLLRLHRGRIEVPSLERLFM